MTTTISAVGRPVKALLRWFDSRPSRTLIALFVIAAGVLRLLATRRAPILLARAGPDHRLALYGQFASSAVAVLAAALTALTVMIAVPDRPRTQALRATTGWRLVQRTLLTTAFLCTITLIVAHVGAGIDYSPKGRKWLEAIMVGAAGTTAIAVLVAGLGLALALAALDRQEDEADPISEGRGAGAS